MAMSASAQLPPAEAAAPPADAKLIEGGEIIARVGDQVILASDVMWQVDRILEMQLAKMGKTLADVPAEQLATYRQQIMRGMVMQLIDTKLVFAEFTRTVPPENMAKIEEAIAGPFEESEIPRLMKIFGVSDRAQLEATLKRAGISLKDVQRQFVERTVAGEWLRQQTPKPQPISHEAMLAYYQDHLKEYEYPAQVRWEELMVRFDRMGGDRTAAWQALGAMGNEVWGKAAANPSLRGPVFGEIAKARSHGFTASEGGLHDWTTLGALKCEELNAALATLAIGQMSNRIESETGFHIVRVLERKAAGRKPFTEAQAEIVETLQAEQKEALHQAQLAKIRRNARVWTIFDGELSGPRLAEALGDKKKG
ncbi:MAG: hypothetical protein DCC67_10085 [Planctomycetota bacterium]|nr:MAG: hypothetical protein DCC67_10085 [Planctomycetota bacterium]